MVNSISEAINASITSPEQGAQQECNKSLFAPPGSTNQDTIGGIIAFTIKFGEICDLPQMPV